MVSLRKETEPSHESEARQWLEHNRRMTEVIIGTITEIENPTTDQVIEAYMDLFEIGVNLPTELDESPRQPVKDYLELSTLKPHLAVLYSYANSWVTFGPLTVDNGRKRSQELKLLSDPELDNRIVLASTAHDNVELSGLLSEKNLRFPIHGVKYAIKLISRISREEYQVDDNFRLTPSLS